MIEITKIPFAGWQRCQQISNGSVALIVCQDIGPRILSYGFLDGENQFQINPREAGLTGGDQWRSYGGHRLWIAPEDPARTLYPDNKPLTVDLLPAGVCLTAPVEETTGFQKSITVEMDGSGSHIRVTHKLMNRTESRQPAAPWAVTVLRPGGVAVLPIGERCDWPKELTAQNSLSLWTYTRLTDPRWTWGDGYILLRQDVKSTNPQKIGMYNSEGWAAYVNAGTLFIKKFDSTNYNTCPDMNSNLETWTNHEILELETLGANQLVEAGAFITHIEDWYLFENISIPDNDKDVEEHILPCFRTIQEPSTQKKSTP
ncbi:MAG: hypothetical protein WCF08_06515 [Anaerolineaceae bacterium]